LLTKRRDSVNEQNGTARRARASEMMGSSRLQDPDELLKAITTKSMIKEPQSFGVCWYDVSDTVK